MLKRWTKFLLKVLLALLALLFLFLLFERVRGQISLARYRQLLLAHGEKLDPRDFTSSATEGENGAPVLFAAIERLKKGNVLPDSYPPCMRDTPSGRAIVGFRLEEWLDDKTTNQWDQMAEDLEANKGTLEEIRAALAKPAFENKLDYTLGPRMLIPHLAPAKTLTYWLRGASQLALHESHTALAATPLVMHIRLPKSLAEDRIAISELVRIAIAAIANTATWEALQADGWTDNDLFQLQTEWAEQNFASNMVHALEGELVFSQVAFELMRDSNKEAAAILYGLEEYMPPEESERPWWERNLRQIPDGESLADFLKKQVYCRVWRFAWLHQCHRHYLERLQRLIEIAREAATPRSFAGCRPALARYQEACSHRNLYDKLRYPDSGSPLTLVSCVNKAIRAETQRSITICAIALKRYSLRHGKLPASLDALLPEFLPSVPIDYMDGKPMKYHLNADGSFALYSVGEDGKDDGGDAALPPDKKGPRNLWNRRDFVWPSPALPEEVEAYRKEARRN